MTDNSNNQPNNPYQPPQSMQTTVVDKKQLQAEVDSAPYPRIKVALGYAILGSLCGAGLIIIILALLEESPNVLFLPYDFLIATMISFIPALLTGIVLSWRKFVIYQWIDYAKVAGLGAIISFVYIFLLSLSVLVFIRGNDIFVASTTAGFIEAISAVIVGKWVLPKK